MTPADVSTPDPKVRCSRGFVAGYGLAQAGAFITFIPLLALLLPEKARAIAGADGAGLLLSQAAMIGGLTAAIANVAFGVLSDRTRGRFGRRRPWIVGGFLAAAAALAMIAMSSDPAVLILGIVLFQLAVNAFYGPLTALVPDLVPDAQKGLVSAWAGAALPVANLFTAVVISRFAGKSHIEYGLVIAASALLILPFALTLRERSAPAPAGRSPGLSFAAFGDPPFARAFAARLLAESAIAVNTLYVLLWLQDAPARTLPPGWTPLSWFGVLLVASTLAGAVTGFAGGLVSDRLRRRRIFVIGGSIAMGTAFAVLASEPVWTAVLGAQILFGAAHGLHATTVAAMTAEILKDPEGNGRDLGIMNMAVALPQSVAPALAAVLFGLGLSIGWIFAAAAAAAILSAIVLAGLKPARPAPLRQA